MKSEDITDTDEDLEPLLVQDKKPSPKKPFGSSLSRSNKPVMKSLKGYHGKQNYDLITALNMWKERQDKPGIKREPQGDVVQPG